jgi:Mn2+/Fe2+ NRAMP family transporter
MNDQLGKIEADRQAIVDARKKGKLALAGTYTRLSGPGWLQSALTLGGGSLGGSLYLGVLGGFSLLWLQPFAMIMGVIMLSAIGYVAMSTREAPFRAINRHINPVLGWAWALASLTANMVWALPQYSLASGVLQQNLLPDLLGPQGPLGDFGGKAAIAGAILVVTLAVTWTYDSGGWGIKLYEMMLKLVVAMIVLCFMGVVIVITVRGDLDWSNVWAGFIPDFTRLWEPAASYDWLLAAVPEASRSYWRELIVNEQQNVIITASAVAVGINMTFLLPYSMIRRGWDKDFRGLAIFDLSTGMFIPFMLATSCVVIASANQFHPRPDEQALLAVGEDRDLPMLPAAELQKLREQKLAANAPDAADTAEGQLPELTPRERLVAETIVAVDYKLTASRMRALSPELVTDRLAAFSYKEVVAVRKELEKLEEATGEPTTAAEEGGEAAASALLEEDDRADVLMAVHLLRKDAFDLSKSLAPLTGRVVADVVFGIGVVGMTLSSITLLMLISGFVICEMLGLPPRGWPNRLGALAATTGVLGPFLWANVPRFWIVVPTSVFGMMLLPIAYWTFFFMMNSPSLLGEEMPRGAKRVRWNVAMGIACTMATIASLYSVWLKSGYYGFIAVGALLALAGIVHMMRTKPQGDTAQGPQ